MSFKSFAALFFLAVVSAESAVAQPAAASLTGYKLATWNIAKLASVGRKMFGDETTPRSQADMKNLGIARDKIGADVYVLQEISSPAVLAEVFPLAEFDLCLSGQWQADQSGLSPVYPHAQVTALRIEPLCYTGAGKLPDTPQPDTLLRQYVAIAVRKSSNIRIVDKKDVPQLSVITLDKRDRKGTADDVVIRNLRWGLEVVLERGGQKTRILGVHLKSSCTDDPIQKERAAFPVDYGDVAETSCAVVSRQLPRLNDWLVVAGRDKTPFLVVGDFNRRLTREAGTRMDVQNRFWSRLTGEATLNNPADNASLAFLPAKEGDKCFKWDRDDYKHPIDYFVFGGGHPVIPDQSVSKLRFDQMVGADGMTLAPADETDPRYPKGDSAAFAKTRDAIADRLSDHCPRLAVIP